MAKIDVFKSRGPALTDEMPADEFYRPAAVPRPRAGRPLPGHLSNAIPATAAQDAEAQDAEAREEEAFLRARRRVPVRRGLMPAGRIQRLGFVFALLSTLLIATTFAYAGRYFLTHDARFRIADSASIQIAGNSEVTRAQLLSIFGDDVDSNIFAVPMKERRRELERLPWVEHATLMRLLPNQLRLSIVERTPIAFVRAGNEIGLVDRNGVLLTMPTESMTAHHYSFPVVTGITQREPLSTRAARMEIYQKFLADLDSGEAKISDQLSEIDLADPEDVKVVLPAEGSDILAHFGQERFLARYKNFKAHYAEWRQQYPNLAAVDLRYDQQVVLQMQKGTEAAGKSNADGPDTSLAADPASANQLRSGDFAASTKPSRPAPAHSPHGRQQHRTERSAAKHRHVFSFPPRVYREQQ